MTSRDRVKSALTRQPVDRVPFGEFAIDFDTAEKILGRPTFLRAKAKSQIAFWEGRRDEVVESWKKDLVDLYRKLPCIDLVNISSMSSGVCPPKGYVCEDPPRRIDANTWEDREGRVFKYSDVTADITMVHDPKLWDREFTVEQFSEPVTVQPPDPSVMEVVDYAVGHLGDDRYLLGPTGGEAAMILLGGMERGLTEFIADPDVVRRATEQATAKANALDPYYVHPGVDGVLWGQDFAYNAGPFLSPEQFRSFCLPSIKARVANVKNKFGKTIFKHACGNNWALLDMFVEAGYDCYQSIQVTAGMEVKKVKEAYGHRLCLWGGLPVELLVSGTMDEVRAAVRLLARDAFPGGGYIFGSSHSIAVGTKYDNFMAMLDEFEKVRYQV